MSVDGKTVSQKFVKLMKVQFLHKTLQLVHEASGPRDLGRASRILIATFVQSTNFVLLKMHVIVSK